MQFLTGAWKSTEKTLTLVIVFSFSDSPSTLLWLDSIIENCRVYGQDWWEWSNSELFLIVPKHLYTVSLSNRPLCWLSAYLYTWSSIPVDPVQSRMELHSNLEISWFSFRISVWKESPKCSNRLNLHFRQSGMLPRWKNAGWSRE